MSVVDIAIEIAKPSTLHDSLRALVSGLRDLLADPDADPAALAAELGALAAHPFDPGRQIAVADLWAEMLTKGTSHVCVHPSDPLIDILRSALEMSGEDKALRVASIQQSIEQPELEKAAAIVELQAQLDAKTAELEQLEKEHDTALAALDEIAKLDAEAAPAQP